MEGNKMIFWGFYLEEKMWGKTGGARIFSPWAYQNTISPNQRENGREKGKKKSHMFWLEISTNKTFLFFPLLSISSFIFFVFFYYFSFIFCPFFCVFILFFFFVHPFVFLICFALLCVFVYILMKYTSIYNWIERIYTIYIFYPSSYFSFQLNKWVLYSSNFLAPNQMKP